MNNNHKKFVICPCGKKIYKKPSESYDDWDKRKYCSRECLKFRKDSEETRKKKAHHLEEHPCWREKVDRNTPVLIKMLKRANIPLDNCMICDKKIKGSKRHIHHKDKDKTNSNLSNLMVVCPKCHKRLDGYGFYTDYAKKHHISQAYAWNIFNPEKAKITRDKSIKKFREKHNIKGGLK